MAISYVAFDKYTGDALSALELYGWDKKTSFPACARPPAAIGNLMARYAAAMERLSGLGGKPESEAASAEIWKEIDAIVDRMQTGASMTINEVAHKLRVTLDLMDEQDPARGLLLSAAKDLTDLATGRRLDFRLA